MNKILIIITFSLVFLSGCATPSKPNVVVKTEYVFKQPPQELLEIPPQDFQLDVDKITQRDVAMFIIRSEERMNIIEEKLKAIKHFYEVK
jgi:PBP1b-binding outer membrane lipoprotein LpoB